MSVITAIMGATIACNRSDGEYGGKNGNLLGLKGLSGQPAGYYSAGYYSAGRYSAGRYSAGRYSAGRYSAGLPPGRRLKPSVNGPAGAPGVGRRWWIQTAVERTVRSRQGGS